MVKKSESFDSSSNSIIWPLDQQTLFKLSGTPSEESMLALCAAYNSNCTFKKTMTFDNLQIPS